jgi:thiol-disulfide isomerase/thioredoxin
LLAIALAGGAAADSAPGYSATALDSSDGVSLADLRGEVVLLNTWATWCTPCKKEMPWLQTLSDRYGSQGLQVIASASTVRGRTTRCARMPPIWE